MTHERYGRWSILSEWDIIQYNRNSIKRKLCVCDCGTFKIVRYPDMKNGMSQSCGCLTKEVASVVHNGRALTHGKSDGRAYQIWKTMVQRCTNEESHNYHNYGGRGINVCERWLDSFENFFEDMGDPPENYSIDRTNNEIGYFKENCRWVPKHIQAINTRKYKSNSSGRTGVYFNKNTGKWFASIQSNLVVYRSHEFSDFDAAVSARKELELKYHGRIRPEKYEDKRYL